MISHASLRTVCLCAKPSATAIRICGHAPTNVERTQWLQPIHVNLRYASSKPKTPISTPHSRASKPANASSPKAKRPAQLPTHSTSTPPPQTAVATKTRPFAPAPLADHIPSGTSIYPARLLIYDAGKPRTYNVLITRLTSILVFGAFSVYLAPPFYYDPLSPKYMAPLLVGLGSVPFVYLQFVSSSLVVYVHLMIPTWARASQTRLIRFVENLPSGTILELTTIRWLFPRLSRMPVRELSFKDKRTGDRSISMRLKRDVPKSVYDERRWLAWRPIKKFLIGGPSHGKLPEQGIWEQVLGCISRGWEKRIGDAMPPR